MIKLIITDMDGTLLDDNNHINEEFWKIERKINEKGIIFAAASGRQYYNLLHRFASIKDDILFIAENGTYVMYKNKELYINTIPKEETIELIEASRGIEETCVVLCGKKSAYVEPGNEKFMEEFRKYYTELQIVDDITKVEDDILKLAVCDFRGSEKNSYTHFKKFENRYKVVVSGKIWLDIMMSDANKGKAVEMIQKKLDISYDETMVFGDYLNDLEMMSTGKYSFAMENAHPLLKTHSNFIAESNNNNGVIKAIKKYVL
ncbi:HAD family hydrolase [Fusobacterium sp.]|uniref:HAD family hydrolase n=1 Tax=Fusobacterium sp. TaxID=68766 RepID=UPI0028FF6996|nr:HAD family hydrolase [Fusobacterium sp.]MDU1910478.1 HAD family hydrolase [Fusobacterium sp.]